MRALASLTAALLISPLGIHAEGSSTQSSEHRGLILRFEDRATLESALEFTTEANIPTPFVYKHVFPGIAVRVTKEQEARLSLLPGLASAETYSPSRLASAGETSWQLLKLRTARELLANAASMPLQVPGTTIYVVDSGVAHSSQLRGRLDEGFAAVAASAQADCTGHGTTVAELAAGSLDGLATNARVSPIRVVDCSGESDSALVLAGLDWIAGANASRASVVNISMVMPASSGIDHAVASLVKRGHVVVVAAGNDEVDACLFSPARAAGAVTVGSTDKDGVRASFSNHGTCVDIFAPGVDLELAAVPSRELEGTSFSAPLVAGFIASFLDPMTDSSAADVARLLQGLSANLPQPIQGTSQKATDHGDR